MHERDVVTIAKQSNHLLRLGKAQQSVVDEDAGELFADGLVNQDSGDRRIDAAREPADHPTIADLRADFLHCFHLERPHGPVALAAGNLAHEVAQQRGAVRRVHHFKVELRGVEPPLLVRDHGDGCIRRGADHTETGGQPRHAVAVTHPNRISLTPAPHAFEQRRILDHRHLRAAELTVVPALDRAAELLRHRLLAVADAEDRHARRIDRGRRERRALLEHRGRPAG